MPTTNKPMFGFPTTVNTAESRSVALLVAGEAEAERLARNTCSPRVWHLPPTRTHVLRLALFAVMYALWYLLVGVPGLCYLVYLFPLLAGADAALRALNQRAIA